MPTTNKEIMSTKQYLSLYLEPSGQDWLNLSQVIKQLAQEFGGPVFVPHLTLIPDRLGTLEEICQTGLRVAQQITWPLTLSFDTVATGATRYQTVFLKAQLTPELTHASATARQLFFADDLPPITPHLSLFYADINNQPTDPAVRDKIADRARELLAELLPITFTCDQITVNTSGENVESWTRLAKINRLDVQAS